MARVFLLVLLLSVCVMPARAGVHRGGTLIMHVSPSVQGSACWESGAPECVLTDPCVNLDACENARTTFAGGSVTTFSVLAAFRSGSGPRLRGVTFGIDYDPSIVLLERRSCGDFELADSNWPASGTGTALTWNVPQTDPLQVVYLFAGYNYVSPQPALFRLTAHPIQGGNFADDHTPPTLDPIAAYGALGFDRAGELPCPDQIAAVGACCLSSGDCILESESDCLAQGGVFQGDDTSCAPSPCPAGVGACCVPGACFTSTRFGCDAEFGYYLGDGSTCEPDPCPSLVGACCFYEIGRCYVYGVWTCLKLEGAFQGDGTTCAPNPCAPVTIERPTWGAIKAVFR